MTDTPGGQERGRREAGFTLVELLVALGLLSFLSVILVSSLHFALQAWERGTGHAERVDHVTWAQRFLRRAIEDAYPFFTAGATTRGRVDFKGTSRSLELLSSTSRALRSGGRSRLSLTVERDGQRLNLVVTVIPELAMDAEQVARKVLLAGVRSVSLSYFGDGRSDRQVGWRDRWVGERRLPRLVRIRISFPPGDKRLWPDLIVAPRIGADVGCVYDPLTKGCRGR